ncbi:MAG: squalene/phytoene synthase family protein [Rhodospirillaceae bacterium]|nr:squalene/phytoene synthase family protein [Rhodospirillaceae bacterium]
MDSAVPQLLPAARSKTARDENFPVAAWFVADRHRPLVAAYYAFARHADDIADDPLLTAEQKTIALNDLESSLLCGTDGVAQTLRAQMAARSLPLTLATQLLIAFRRDAVNTPVNSLEDLMDYCRSSAAPVGRFMLAIHDETIDLGASDSLCAALQVLNHIQDAQDDWRTLKRCYIPKEWLDAEGVGADAFLARAMSHPVKRVVDPLLDHVDVLLATSRPLPAQIKDRGLSAQVRAIHTLAVRLSARLRRTDILAEKVTLSVWDWWAAFMAGANCWMFRA